MTVFARLDDRVSAQGERPIAPTHVTIEALDQAVSQVAKSFDRAEPDRRPERFVVTVGDAGIDVVAVERR